MKVPQVFYGPPFCSFRAIEKRSDGYGPITNWLRSTQRKTLYIADQPTFDPNDVDPIPNDPSDVENGAFRFVVALMFRTRQLIVT